MTCRSGGTGRRAAFRALCPQGRAGSNPAFGTKKLSFVNTTKVFYFLNLIASKNDCGGIVAFIYVYEYPVYSENDCRLRS